MMNTITKLSVLWNMNEKYPGLDRSNIPFIVLCFVWNGITGIIFSPARTVWPTLIPPPTSGYLTWNLRQIVIGGREGGGREEGTGLNLPPSLHRCDHWSLMWRLINFTLGPSQGSHRQHFFIPSENNSLLIFDIYRDLVSNDRRSCWHRVTHLISGTSKYSRAKLAMSHHQTRRTRNILKVAHL